MQGQGGFIAGFDYDNDAIFHRLAELIQESGILTAMVGLLNAPAGTKLYLRLSGEGRILKNITGENINMAIPFSIYGFHFRKIYQNYLLAKE